MIPRQDALRSLVPEERGMGTDKSIEFKGDVKKELNRPRCHDKSLVAEAQMMKCVAIRVAAVQELESGLRL